VCERKVVERVVNVGDTTIVRDAWARGQDLMVHGRICGLKGGLARDFAVSVREPSAAETAHRAGVDRVQSRVSSGAGTREPSHVYLA
jgi:carbonic anhydrase